MYSIVNLRQETPMSAEPSERRGQTVLKGHMLQHTWHPLLAYNDTVRDAQWGPRDGPYIPSALGAPADDFRNPSSLRDEVA